MNNFFCIAAKHIHLLTEFEKKVLIYICIPELQIKYRII